MIFSSRLKPQNSLQTQKIFCNVKNNETMKRNSNWFRGEHNWDHRFPSKRKCSITVLNLQIMIMNILLLFILCSSANGLITGRFNIYDDTLKIMNSDNLLCTSLRVKIQQKKIIDTGTRWILHSNNSNQRLMHCYTKHHSVDMNRNIITESSTRRKTQHQVPALPFLRYPRKIEWNAYNPKSTRLFIESSATAITSVDNISISDHEETGQNNVNIFITQQSPFATKNSVTGDKNSIENITDALSNIQNSGYDLETDKSKTSENLQQQQQQQQQEVSPEDDVPKPTSNGGYTHTASSKAKISEANRGKTPWNKGRKRSAEDKARISAGVKARNREKLLKKIADMGMTEEEYNAKLEEDKRRIAEEKAKRRTAKGGYIPTAETKAKISKILLEKHKNGEIKKRSRASSSATRKGKKHSEETKKKISMSLKARWQGDPAYKENIKSKVKQSNSSEAVRERISNALKEKWKDPEFRAYMMERMKQRRQPTSMKRDAEYRRKISESMKRKWEDPEYRAKAMNGMVGKKTSKPSAKRKASATVKNESDVSPIVKKKKEKKTTSRKTPSVSATPASPLTLAEFAPKKVPKKNKRKKRALKNPQKTSSKSTVSKVGENKEEQIRESKMDEEPIDLHDRLHGAENQAELKISDKTKSSNNYFADDTEVDEFDDLFGDDEDDFNLDEFDPYGLDELEQSRY